MKYVLSAHDTHFAVDAEKYDACISFLSSRSQEWLKRELSFTRNLGFYQRIIAILPRTEESVSITDIEPEGTTSNTGIGIDRLNNPGYIDLSDIEIFKDVLMLLKTHYGKDKAESILSVFPQDGIVAYIRELSRYTNYESVIEQMRSDVDYFSFVFFSKRN